MYREELVLGADLDPSVATLIKHGFSRHIRWPALPLGVVLVNTTTAIAEEWLTATESMPTRKVFHAHTKQILSGALKMCVYLKKTQTEGVVHVSMYDFDYYLIREDATLAKVDKPEELKQTLMHTFLDYRLKNIKTIELIAFSSGTEIREDLVNNLSFLDIETFNREHANIRGTFPSDFRSSCPFQIVAPCGRLRIFFEAYPWINTRKHFREIMALLHAQLADDVRDNKVQVTDDLSFGAEDVSKYSIATKTLLVRDIVTMCVVNFLGCNAQLGTYHKFNMSAMDTKKFLSALDAAFKKIAELV